MSGTMNRLAQWFQAPRSLNAPDDFQREDFLMDVYNAEAVAKVNETTIMVRTPNGRCAIEKKIVAGTAAILEFDYLPNATFERFSFWFNESSVRDLRAALVGRPKVTVEEIFTGQK